MTAEMHKLANDPNFVVQFAIGEPLPNLIAQSKDSGIRMSGVYFDTTKRYIMKHAHMSKEDVSTHRLHFFNLAFLSCFAVEEDSSICIFGFFRVCFRYGYSTLPMAQSLWYHTIPGKIHMKSLIHLDWGMVISIMPWPAESGHRPPMLLVITDTKALRSDRRLCLDMVGNILRKCMVSTKPSLPTLSDYRRDFPFVNANSSIFSLCSI